MTPLTAHVRTAVRLNGQHLTQAPPLLTKLVCVMGLVMGCYQLLGPHVLAICTTCLQLATRRSPPPRARAPVPVCV